MKMAQLIRVFSSSSIGLMMVTLLTSCGGGGSSPAPSSQPSGPSATLSTTYAYVTDQTTNEIAQYRVNADGTLTTLGGNISTGASSQPIAIAVDPAHKYAYVVLKTKDRIDQYAIHSDGTLSTTPLSSVSTGSEPFAIALTPSGRYAYVTNMASTSVPSVSQYSVDSVTGTLHPLPTPTIATGAVPKGLTIDRSEKFVYVASAGDLKVYQYAIDPTGQLLPPTSTASGGTASRVILDPSNQFLYVSNNNVILDPLSTATTIIFNDINSSIAQFTTNISTTATLAAQTPPSLLSKGALGLAVHPTKPVLYATNSFILSTVSQFTIGSGGTLSAMTTPTVLSGSDFNPPLHIVIDPTGTHAFVLHPFIGSTSGPTGLISRYTIEAATGALSFNGTVPSGLDPSAMAFAVK